MAYDMRHGVTRREQNAAEESHLLHELMIVQSCLSAHCFDTLNILQKTAARVAIFIAAKAVSRGHAKIELRTDGWSIERTAPSPKAEPLHEMIERSYSRDIASQKARVALAPEVIEADDRYFVPDDEEPYFPEMILFRQQMSFERECV